MLVENKTRKIFFFQGRQETVLTQNRYQQARGSKHLKFMSFFFCNISTKFRVFNFRAPFFFSRVFPKRENCDSKKEVA